MTKTIFKYPLRMADTQSVEMPKGAEVLSVQSQGETLCLWALVNTKRPNEKRVFEVFGTGNPIHCDTGIERKFIATAQMPNLPLVWHVFERVD